MARTGNQRGAKIEIEALEALEGALRKAGDRYWADRTREQVLAVSAWIALANGDREMAIRSMRSAADGEDGSLKHVAMENRLYPLRELLGDLLLELGQAPVALTEYEKALMQNPNRYRGIYGAARAAEASGDRQKAAAHYAKLVLLAREGDGSRPELVRAQRFLAQRH